MPSTVSRSFRHSFLWEWHTLPRQGIQILSFGLGLTSVANGNDNRIPLSSQPLRLIPWVSLSMSYTTSHSHGRSFGSLHSPLSLSVARVERLAHAMIRRKPATGEEMEGRKDRSTPPLATLRLGLYGEVISSLPTDHLLSTSRSRPHSLISLEGRARSVMGRFLLAYGSSEPIVMRWGWEARRMWRVRWLPLPSHAGLRVTHLLRTRHREVKQRQ